MTQAEQDLTHEHNRGRITAPHRPSAPGQEPTLDSELHDLSDGNVVRARPSGPAFVNPPRRLRLRPTTFVRALSARRRVAAAALTLAWVACLVSFWMWWLRPEHRVTWTGMIVNSALLLYLTFIPAYFQFAFSRVRRVNPKLDPPQVRVAFVVTRAPSEEWAVARTTLEGMLAQEFPSRYDVWLCDEAPSDEVLRWCREHGVRVSSRYGVTEYHRSTWPRRTRCKEGNLAYFYDTWGYREYDVVAQLDCDHVPSPTYLTEMTRAFADPAIGYVAAPSICDANAAQSWSARGRLYREAPFHGAFQLGHSGGLGPLCIGSHYAVRTRALRDIGGLGPELAEDFSTTFLLNSAGWHGAFAIDAEAHGEGPLAFADMLTQEFQWSRSLTVMLFGLLPRHLGRLSWRMRARFAFVLTYYPVLAATTIAGTALPPIAAVTGLPWVNVSYFEFLVRFWAMYACLLTLLLLMRRWGLLRPRKAPLISWEGSLFLLTRWPFVAWGVFAGIVQTMRPRPVTFKVTPKARGGLETLPARLVAPYAVITALLSSAAVFGELNTDTAGYVFLSLLTASTYAVVAFAVSGLHAAEAARAFAVRRSAAVATVRGPLAVSVAALLPLSVAIALYPSYLIQVLGW